ncbi:MAG: CoA synthetase, partial [Candidatus Rokuibacteriota bacterium]
RGVLVVESLHPGVGPDELARRTGFSPEYDADVHTTPAPSSPMLGVLRSRVRDVVARTYPRYAERAFGG